MDVNVLPSINKGSFLSFPCLFMYLASCKFPLFFPFFYIDLEIFDRVMKFMFRCQAFACAFNVMFALFLHFRSRLLVFLQKYILYLYIYIYIYIYRKRVRTLNPFKSTRYCRRTSTKKK